MRVLTITREKKFAACLAKVKVYIEDPNSSEIVINSIPCRKLGTLKNGETKSFEIEDNAVKVFVIGDVISKEYCNDYYQVPEGTEDIALSGKNIVSPTSGNPFVFNNNDSHDIKEYRKKKNRKGLIIFIVALIVGIIIGLLPSLKSITSNKEKVFTYNDMSITLNRSFREVYYNGFTVSYENNDTIILMLEEKFSLEPSLQLLSLNDYAQTVISVNEIDAEIEKNEDLTYFSYSYFSSDDNQTFYYYDFVYKTDDSFWLIQFAGCDENCEEQFINYAKTINFNN